MNIKPLRPLFGWITAVKGRRKGSTQRMPGRVLAVNFLAYRPASYEMNLLRPDSGTPRGSGRAAGVSEFHLDVPRELGAAAQLAAPARGARREAGIPAVHASLSATAGL